MFDDLELCSFSVYDLVIADWQVLTLSPGPCRDPPGRRSLSGSKRSLDWDMAGGTPYPPAAQTDSSPP